jgi:formylmethanofuran dehydrogenase subunit C
VLKARSIPSVRIGGSSSLVDFPDLEVGVDARDSIRSRRLENASRTVASLSKFGVARARAGDSQAANCALSCSISALAAPRSSWRVVVVLDGSVDMSLGFSLEGPTVHRVGAIMSVIGRTLAWGLFWRL